MDVLCTIYIYIDIKKLFLSLRKLPIVAFNCKTLCCVVCQVTIFGESAGAQSVSLHLMIQSSKPLFKQAALQSLPFSIPLKTRWGTVSWGSKLVPEMFLILHCLSSKRWCINRVHNPWILTLVSTVKWEWQVLSLLWLKLFDDSILPVMFPACLEKTSVWSL